MNDIPEGYTYKRCDIYTKAEFLEYYKGKSTYDICKQYVKDHPKKEYNTDDEIAIYQITQSKVVRPIANGRKTTKRYKYDEV